MKLPTIARAVEVASIVCAIAGALVLIMCLHGCGTGIPARPDVSKSVTEAVAARVEAEHTADAAIKTSAEARDAANVARSEARAARDLADEKDGQVKRLEALAVDLQNAEIARRITLASWWLAGVGLIVAAVGSFLFLRFQSRTAGIAALCGIGCIGAGVLGMWLAPHWILVAWSFGAVLLTAAIGGLVWLLVHRDASSTYLAGELKRYASAIPDSLRERLDAESLEAQSASMKKNIDQWLNRAKTIIPSDVKHDDHG